MTYSGVFVFGDSLVDAGNALQLAQTYNYFPFTSLPNGAPTASKGYYDGRFTNGLTFADLIANKYLGVPTKPVFPFGYDDPYLGISFGFFSDPSGNNLNFAYGGGQIRQGDEAVPDSDDQTDAYRDAVDGDADPGALHMFVFGANDVHDLVPRTGAWADLALATATLQKAANELIEEVRQTIEIGARKILIVGVPDIGIQPYYNDLADEAARRSVATEYAALLDTMIKSQLDKLQLPGVDLDFVDFGDMSEQVLGTMAQLYSAAEIFPLNRSNEVFFDLVHPTAQLHALAAGFMIDQLNGVAPSERTPLPAPDFSADAGIGAKGEVDHYSFALAANTTYRFDVLGISSLGGNYTVLADPNLRITGPGGTLVGSDDDGGLGLDSSFVFTTVSAGTYGLVIGGVGSATGSYRVTANGTALGDNVYTVAAASTIVLERPGEGFDTVRSSVSYVLQSDASIERLSTTWDGGKAAINLTGNAFDQTLVGNAGSNLLDGKSGNDELWGLAGTDRFAFTTALGSGNVDRIADFRVRDDTIWLDDAIFKGLALGTLASGAFVKGSHALQSDDRIIYDPSTGKLFFDPDGTGAEAQVLFATVSTGLKITAADFFIF